ncbi:MAG TPA: glycosyltransferase family 39 protein [Candidatus Acidoferrales bacterium]|nr:glycosyltransferase family 39 protein [Candidatus Acidoferrales bacterium]
MKRNCARILSSPAFVAGFAFVLRAILVYLGWHSGPKPTHENLPYGLELGRVARAIAAGEGFSSPLLNATSGPTAWFTPLYPYLIAGIFKLWGIYSATSHVIIQMMNCCFSALTIFPIYGIAKRTFGSGVAIGASWLWVFLPTALYYPMLWVWDTTLVALVFSLIFWATLAMRGNSAVRSWLGYGGLWAIGVLINPSILSLFPFFVAWLVWELRRTHAAWLKPVTAALLLFAICLVPWTARNYRVFGKLIVLRSNFGLELWLGNNPQVTDTSAQWQHPSSDSAEAAKYVRMGEIAYMAEKQHEAVAYMRSHPAETLNLVFRRFEMNWLAFSDSPVDVWVNGDRNTRIFLALNCFLSVGCLVGVLVAQRARLPEAAPYAMVLLIFPAVFYVTHASSRYRFPIDPIILILATGAVAHALSLARRHDTNLSKTIAPEQSMRSL